jgi:hypothetical protein
MTDIQVGDLVKATRKTDPEISMTGRVRDVRPAGVSLPYHGSAFFNYWDFEVLDRPAPPIDEELLKGAKRAWFSASNVDQQDWKAVINFVREYDKKNATKENA